MIRYFSEENSSRTDHIFRRININDKIIEIGGSYNPIFRRSDGFNVWTADHDTQDNLKKKYEFGPTKELIDNIQIVDFVATDGNLDMAVSRDHLGSFDFAISSHNIEHIPNPIAHLHSVSNLLSPDGTYIMVVPDKRGTYDLLRSLTTTGGWIEAFIRKEPYHGPQQIFDNAVYSLIHEEKVTWYPPSVYGDMHLSPSNIENAYSSAVRHLECYRDAHAWAFTPSSMLLILRELHSLQITSLYPSAIISDGGQEFIVELKKMTAVPLADDERLALLVSACREQASVHINLPDFLSASR